MISADPIPVTVRQWRCPFCPRATTRRYRILPHIERCEHNPAVHACRTCWRFEGGECVVGLPTVMVDVDRRTGEERKVMTRGCDSWVAIQ